MAASNLRLVVGENRGVSIDVDDPRLLRVEIAAARAAAREACRSEAAREPSVVSDPDRVRADPPASPR